MDNQKEFEDIDEENGNPIQNQTIDETGNQTEVVPQQTEEPNVRRLKWKCKEVIAEALDVLWATNERYVWTAQKQMYCPNLITKDDEKEINSIIKKLKPLSKALNDCKFRISSTPNKLVFNEIYKRVDSVLTDILKLTKLCEELKNKINISIAQKNLNNNSIKDQFD